MLKAAISEFVHHKKKELTTKCDMFTGNKYSGMKEVYHSLTAYLFERYTSRVCMRQDIDSEKRCMREKKKKRI